MAGPQPVDDLLLEHQHHVGDLVRLLQPTHQQGRRDIVRQVGDDPTGRGAELRQDSPQSVGLDDLQSPGRRPDQLLEGGDGPGVDFDGDHVAGALKEQGAGEPPRAGTDLDHGSFGERRRGTGNAPRQVEVEEEMLAEALARIKTVGGDGLAQRRQPGERVHFGLGAQL